MKVHSIGLLLLASFISCSTETGGEINLDAMCPSEGANLFLKCADGKSKIFELGYNNAVFKPRKDGKWGLKDGENFCEEEPKEIQFYLNKAHFQVTMRSDSGITLVRSWKSVNDNCIMADTTHRWAKCLGYKIESIPITNAKPDDI